MTPFKLGACVITILLLTHTVTADDSRVVQWPQFRGPHGHAIAGAQDIPVNFDSASTLWEKQVPAGSSSPIIWNNKLFLTGHKGNRLLVLCYHKDTGKELWRDEVTGDFDEDYEHEDCSPAAATSCCNGEQLISSFGTFGLIAHDLDGNELWRHKIQNREEAFGSGSSPILQSGSVFFLRDTTKYSALYCLNAKSGRIKWKAPRSAFAASYSTPYIWNRDDATELVVAGSGTLDGYDPETGEQLWTVTGLPAFICPSPVAKGDRLVFGAWTTANVSGEERTRAGFAAEVNLTNLESKDPVAFMKRFDLNGNGRIAKSELPPSRFRDAFRFTDRDKSDDWDLKEVEAFFNAKPAPGRNLLVALNAGGRGDITETHVVWESTKNLPYVSSPLIYRDRVYCLKKGGLLTSWDLETGDLDRPLRLGVGGEYYATPLAVGDHIMLAAERGAVIFLSVAAEKPKLVAKNDFAAGLAATPAILDGTIYIRSRDKMHAIQK